MMPWQFQSVPCTPRLRLDLHAMVHKALMLQKENFFEAFNTGLKHQRLRTACPLGHICNLPGNKFMKRT